MDVSKVSMGRGGLSLQQHTIVKKKIRDDLGGSGQYIYIFFYHCTTNSYVYATRTHKRTKRVGCYCGTYLYIIYIYGKNGNAAIHTTGQKRDAHTI